MIVWPEHAAHARRLRHTRDFLFEVVHVCIRRRARLDHLQGGESRAGSHHFARHGFGFRRKNVLFEPFLKAQIVGKTPVQHHRRVTVRVDETRDDDRTGSVDLLWRLEARGDIGGRPYRDDGRSIDRDSAGVVDISRPVNRYDRAARHDGGDLLRCRLCRGRHQRARDSRRTQGTIAFA